MLFCAVSLSAQTYDLSAVDQLLQDSLAVLGGTGPDDFGGVTLLIWKDEKLIFDKSYALPGKTFSKTRLLPIASASKWVSGAVITSMLEKGQLTLDDSVAQYIPTAPLEKRPLTMRQLFSFTSGFRSNLSTLVPCVEDVNSTVTLAECVSNVLDDPLVSEPGQLLNYGSEGMQVAGRMAEVASGLAYPSGDCWDSIFTRNIARPLGWVRTSWDINLLYNTNNPRIDGGVFSTAEEYLRLTRMILARGVYNGTRVISEAWIDSMLADQTRGARISYTPYLGMESLFPGIKNTRYGIGVWRERIDSSTDAALEVASQGKFGFSPWVDFERGYCAVLAVKSNDVASIYPSYMEIKRLIREALDAPTSVAPEPAPAPWNVVGHYDLLGREVPSGYSGAALRVETDGRARRATMVMLP
jgi:CubicO group peptidase (beta-lactamase class C family)